METMLMQNFGGTNKEYYGIFESGLCGFILSHSATMHCIIQLILSHSLSIPKLMHLATDTVYIYMVDYRKR